jgi:hypothetical protein
MEITDNRFDQGNRKYFVNKAQYELMKNNQRVCAMYKTLGHEACRKCKKMTFEKWRLCHILPVEGSQHKSPEWKR